jgi:hypothetical protein
MQTAEQPNARRIHELVMPLRDDADDVGVAVGVRGFLSAMLQRDEARQQLPLLQRRSPLVVLLEAQLERFVELFVGLVLSMPLVAGQQRAAGVPGLVFIGGRALDVAPLVVGQSR